MNDRKNNLPQVVIFGRTNVGKSTLFNTLIEKRQAIISDTEGTTRDANYGTVSWNGKKFTLIDTGGIMDIKNLLKPKKKEKTENNDIDTKVQKKVRTILKQADLILFLVDVKDGLLPTDKQMALQLQKTVDTNKIILVVNKADNPRLRQTTSEFNRLGLNEPIAISATTGSGTGDLLDEVLRKINFKQYKPAEEKAEDLDKIKVAIIGKPNVGKSSLLNKILGEEKVIVSPIPHTTREPQDTEIIHDKHIIKLIDTAGISKRGQKDAKRLKHKNTLEKFSIKKSLQTIRKADIALLVVDISTDLTIQESKLIEEIIKTGTSIIIIANKWDLIKTKDTKAYTEIIHRHFPYALWAPIMFCSAYTGAKVNKIMDKIIEINEQRQISVSDNALIKFLNKAVKHHAPAKGKGMKKPYIYELKQENTAPPGFSVRIGAKDNLLESYLRYIENRLREKFGFVGTPIKIWVEKNRHIHGKHEEHKNHDLSELEQADSSDSQ